MISYAKYPDFFGLVYIEDVNAITGIEQCQFISDFLFCLFAANCHGIVFKCFCEMFN